MTILNYNEKKLSLVFDYKFDQEQTSTLISAVIAAIRWNSLCNKYEIHDVDGENVYTLTLLLDRLTNATFDKGCLVLDIPSIEPKKEKSKMFSAIIAAFRWNAICDGTFKTKMDNEYVHFLAIFLNDLIEDKEIFSN